MAAAPPPCLVVVIVVWWCLAARHMAYGRGAIRRMLAGFAGTCGDADRSSAGRAATSGRLPMTIRADRGGARPDAVTREAGWPAVRTAIRQPPLGEEVPQDAPSRRHEM